VDHLRRLGKSAGFEVTAIAPVQWKGAPISSTRIRESVAAGRFDDARNMLGQSYVLSGVVVRGRQVGRKLGFPTVNIVPETDVLPPHGVFAVLTEIDGRRIPGAAYYGHRSARPGVEGEYFLEVYLFDLDEDLYDRFIRIRFVSFIRPDRQFASDADLIEQIRLDTAAVRTELDRHAAETSIPTRS
jgi:riboflavin kinase/FMN adenylyltransferase